MSNLSAWLNTLFFLLVVSTATAQESISWRKFLKNAQTQHANKDFAEAAHNYEQAFYLNSQKFDLAENAALCYLEIRNYDAATKLLQQLVQHASSDNKYLFYYAIALHYQSNYQQAKDYFHQFSLRYQAADKNELFVQTEQYLRACNFGIEALRNSSKYVKVRHLKAPLNSNSADFAPQPFSNDILYFSSTRNNSSAIFRTIKKDSNWASPQIPPVYVGNMDYPDFCNGSFSDDGQRFYFTQCHATLGVNNCAIYFMELNSSNQWSNPILLPDYVNLANSNTTHPHVSTQNGYETLYFASDRQGGQGGLDLWYTTRQVGSDISSFTLPKNLGNTINTKGDEITPFYNAKDDILYFSSNGLIGAGGLDIFKSEGYKINWSPPQNMGVPINSSTDDLYFVVNEAHGGGYLVSNRKTATKKNTSDDDIFYVELGRSNVLISGKIINKDSIAVPNTMIKVLYESNNQWLVFDSLYSHDGIYQFSIEGIASNYLLECYNDDYQSIRQLLTVNSNQSRYFKDIVLQKLNEADEPLSKLELYHLLVAPTYNSVDNYYELPIHAESPSTQTAYTGDTLSVFYELDALAGLAYKRRLFYDSLGVLQPLRQIEYTAVDEKPVETLYPETEQEIKEDIEYKIQVAAVRTFKEEKFKSLTAVGELSIETLDGGLKRIMVLKNTQRNTLSKGFKRKSAALNVLAYIMQNTRFKQAFVVKYVGGKRIGDGFRGWDETQGLETDAKPDGKVQVDYEGF